MKKYLLAMLCLVVFWTLSVNIMADEMDVESIDMEYDSVDKDYETVELLQGEDVEIKDFAIVNAYLFTTPDIIYIHKSGYKPDYTSDLINFIGGVSRSGIESGEDAELATLYVDITNLDTTPKNFLENVSVNLIFKDKYPYDGYGLQYNPYVVNEFFEEPANEIAIHPDDVFEIEPLYTGHYSFVCKIPNRVVDSIGEDNAPMKMEIIIDNYKMEYYINK